MLDVNKLALLREVATHGGISSAAESLRMSPSNVSQQLRRLEREYDVALLEAAGRGVRLTPTAEHLVRRTEEVLAILEEAETDLASDRQVGTRTVRLAGFHTFAVGLLGAVVARLSVEAPELALEFVQQDPKGAIDEVLTRRADLAVVDEYDGFPLPPSPGIVRSVLGHEPVRAYLPAGFDATRDPALDPAFDPALDLTPGGAGWGAVNWAMEPQSSDASRWSRSVCREAGFEPRVRYVSPDPYVHRRLLEQGVAAAFLPETVALDLPDSVRGIDVFPPTLSRTHTLILRRGTERSAAVRAVRSAIAATLAEAVGAH